MDVVDQLQDLVQQATTEHSHYYVAGAAARAAEEIKHLRALNAQLQKSLIAALELNALARPEGKNGEKS